jgi:hypothetical protein
VTLFEPVGAFSRTGARFELHRATLFEPARAFGCARPCLSSLNLAKLFEKAIGGRTRSNGEATAKARSGHSFGNFVIDIYIYIYIYIRFEA